MLRNIEKVFFYSKLIREPPTCERRYSRFKIFMMSGEVNKCYQFRGGLTNFLNRKRSTITIIPVRYKIRPQKNRKATYVSCCTRWVVDGVPIRVKAQYFMRYWASPNTKENLSSRNIPVPVRMKVFITWRHIILTKTANRDTHIFSY
jgi:hypothetical protein